MTLSLTTIYLSLIKHSNMTKNEKFLAAALLDTHSQL